MVLLTLCDGLNKENPTVLWHNQQQNSSKVALSLCFFSKLPHHNTSRNRNIERMLSAKLWYF